MGLGRISVFLVSQQLQAQLHFLVIPKLLINKILLVVCKTYCCVWVLSVQVKPCTPFLLTTTEIEAVHKKLNRFFSRCPSVVSCKIRTFFEKSASLKMLLYTVSNQKLVLQTLQKMHQMGTCEPVLFATCRTQCLSQGAKSLISVHGEHGSTST